MTDTQRPQEASPMKHLAWAHQNWKAKQLIWRGNYRQNEIRDGSSTKGQLSNVNNFPFLLTNNNCCTCTLYFIIVLMQLTNTVLE